MQQLQILERAIMPNFINQYNIKTQKTGQLILTVPKPLPASDLER